MITFSPILKPIQKTLLKKMRFLNKGADTFNIGETLSDDGGDPKQSNYMFTRSVFLRMVSMLTSDGKPITLLIPISSSISKYRKKSPYLHIVRLQPKRLY